MNTTIFHRRRAERFAQLVDEATGGRRHHVRTRLDAQLAELVAIGHQVSALPTNVELDPEFRTGLRAMLVATAEREGIGRTATASTDTDLAPAHRAPARRAGTRRSPATRRPAGGRPNLAPGRIRARGAIVVGVAVGAIAVSGMSAASENAVPGDALYPVKRSAERAQIALASSDVTRGQLYLDFARTRVAEAASLPSGDDGYGTALDDMDADTMQGVRMLTTAAVRRRDSAALEVVDAFVISQRHALAALGDHGSGQDRERTARSLALVDAVAKRVDALRTTLSCGNGGATGSDQLGPKPRSCTAGATPQQGTGDQPAKQQPTGEGSTTPRTENTDPNTAPGTVPSTPAGVDASVPAVPTDPAAGDDGGVLGDLGRIFDDLLG